jgi:hypothetical protein
LLLPERLRGFDENKKSGTDRNCDGRKADRSERRVALASRTSA